MWSSMFMVPFVVLLMSLMVLFSGSTVSFSWGIVIMEMEMNSFFYIDFLSIYFLVVVSVVSLAVLLYSVIYMSSSVMKVKFIISLLMFIVSMLFLSISADMFWVMVGWDGLGLTSLYLIMFFQNWKSFNSSMITFLLNRLGDGLILIALIWGLGAGVTSSFFSSSEVYLFFLVLGALSKSAQVPFSSWLPLAMAAPTPVSSLVHSSTLVTAGIYLLIRFNSLLSDGMMFMVYIISSLTILLAGISSLGEYDLKKIIALSTLSHIGLMLMFISKGAISSALVHLFTHAMFKSLLFMISGVIIHSGQSNQDIRLLNYCHLDSPTGVSLIVSLSSMVGLPFFSGFFSKELFIRSMVAGVDYLLLVVFILAASITSAYSMRIMFSMLTQKGHFSASLSYSPYWFVFFFMIVMAVFSGQMAVVLIEDSVFVIPIMTPEFYYASKMIFVYVFLGMVVGAVFVFIQGKLPSWAMSWSHSMWFINSFTLFVQDGLFKSSFLMFTKMDSKGVIDWLFFSKKKSMEVLSEKILRTLVPYPLFIISVPFYILFPLYVLW